MTETIVVVLIVSMAAFTAGRSFCRTMTGKNDGCGCAGNCHGCACKDFAETVKGISSFGQNRKEQLPVTRDVLVDGNPSARNHGPEAVRSAGSGLPEERNATTGDRNLSTRVTRSSR